MAAEERDKGNKKDDLSVEEGYTWIGDAAFIP